MLSEIGRKDLFPTLLFTAHLEGADALNVSFMRAIAAERQADETGLKRSNQPRLGGWHSRDNLHREAEFLPLVRAVNAISGMVSEQLGYAAGARPGLAGMWAIENGPGAANRAHVHPGALWSGVYYVSVPEGAGDIEFTDPRTANLMRQPRYDNRPDSCAVSYRVRPEAGLIVLFPSWLYHEVHPNLSNEDRVIISFNLA